VAVILKVLLVNLLAAPNFASVFFNEKNVWKVKNVQKEVKKRDQNKKNVKNVFYICGTCLQCFDAVDWAAGRASGL